MLNSKHDYFEVGNGSRRTLRRVPEMMDTPPIQNDYAFIFFESTFLLYCCNFYLLCPQIDVTVLNQFITKPETELSLF